MNPKTIKTTVTLFVIVTLILGGIKFREFYLAIGSPTGINPPDPLETELAELISQYEDGSISVIDLTSITRFSWDKVYIFGPYTQPSEIETAVGKSWQKNCNTEIASLENSTLLLFTNNEKVVHCTDYPMDKNDFVSLYRHTEGFSFNEAQFTLSDTGNLIWIGNQ